MPFLPKIALCILTVLLSGVVGYLLALLYDETGQHGKAKATVRYLLQKEVKVQSKAIYIHYKNKLRNFVFLSLFLYVLSCKVQVDTADKSTLSTSIRLQKEYNTPKVLKLSGIANKISYISLETNKDILIGRIWNPFEDIQFADTLIFINGNHELFLFHINGAFIRKIGARGEGPGEFTGINGFSINTTTQQVIIKSDAQQKLFIYGFDGVYHKYIPLGKWPSHVAVLNNEFIILANEKGRRDLNNYYAFSIINSKGKELSKLLKMSWEEDIEKKKEKIDLFGNAFFYNHLDTLSYWEVIYNKIYRIVDQNRVYEIFDIDLGSNKLPLSYMLESNTNKLHDLITHTSLQMLVECGNYLFISVGNKKRLITLLFDKNTKAVYNVKNDCKTNSLTFINDLDFGINFWPQGRVNDNSVFSLAYSYEIADHFANNQGINSLELNIDLSEIIENADITDNPVIMIVELKQ
jgi:hypothetical protein